MRLIVCLPLLLAPLLAGCPPDCEDLCRERAFYIEDCLETWDATWVDLGFDGVREDGTAYPAGPPEEYVTTCDQAYLSGEVPRVCGAELAELEQIDTCGETPPDVELASDRPPLEAP